MVSEDAAATAALVAATAAAEAAEEDSSNGGAESKAGGSPSCVSKLSSLCWATAEPGWRKREEKGGGLADGDTLKVWQKRSK